ncbi:MAG: LPS export ABC transporter periplasmic protein LptC [Bacteroidetes bacterium]|nr:LPS export ABC transporter periplasmic protein LptC [Bacteroidota bacterium]
MINCKQHIIPLNYWAAFLISCFFIYSCENDIKQVNDLTGKKEMVDVAKDVESFLSQQGKMKARLRAPLMLRHETDTLFTEFPKTLHVDFFADSTNKIESQLNSMYGKYYEDLNRVFLRDSVVVFNVKGDTLRCPELWWDQNQQKFYTDKFVRIRTKDKIIFGNGLEAGQDFSWYIITHPTGSVLVNDNGFSQ